MRCLALIILIIILFTNISCVRNVGLPVKDSLPIKNETVKQCSSYLLDATPRYSISPNGNYLLNYLGHETNEQGRYVTDGASYNGRKKFQIFELNQNLDVTNSPKLIFETNSYKYEVGFAWGLNKNVYFKPLKFPAEFLSLNIKNGVEKEIPFNEIDSGLYLDGQNSTSANTLLSLQRDLNYQGWRPNVFGQKTFRQLKKNDTKPFIELQAYLYPVEKSLKGTASKDIKNETIISFNPLVDTVELFPSQNFRNSDNILRMKLKNKNYVSYFYFKGNTETNFTALFKVEDIGGRLIKEKIFEPKDADISSVSFNRNGSVPYWAIVESTLPKYYFLHPEGKSMFDQINLNVAHRSKIVSMDNLGVRKIVQRESMRHGIEYILLDNQSKETVILSQCWSDEFNPWATVEGLNFMASDGAQIRGYIYLPTNIKGPFPTIVYAHGGPSSKESFSWSNLYFKSLVDRGYAVVVPNYRGSTGYGRKFRESGWQNFERPRLDLIEAAEHVAKLKFIDRKRMAIMGNSYGGYLSLSTATLEKHPFKAAISRNGITNLIELLEKPYKIVNGREYRYNQESKVFGDISEQENRSYLTRNSPSLAVNNINTPLFIAHAKGDTRIPLDQSKKFTEVVLNKNPKANIKYFEIPGDHYATSLNTIEAYISQVDSFLNSIFDDNLE